MLGPFGLSYLPETLPDCLTFRTAETRRQKLWKPSGNLYYSRANSSCVSEYVEL